MDTQDNKVTVLIHTYNAEQHLEEVIDSVKCFDEVLVCDMESTNSTVDIAQRMGCRVITFAKGNHNCPEPARDWAIHQAEHEWVFVVDADELVPEALAEYLKKRILEPNCPDGLYIPRTNQFLGRNMRTNAQDYQLRFFRRDLSTWPPFIHTFPQVRGKVERVPLIEGVRFMHINDAPLSQMLSKFNGYTDDEVAKRKDIGYGVGSLLFRPLWFFVRSYFFQCYWRNGVRGLIYAMTMAFYQYMRVAKILEYHMRRADEQQASK